MVWLGRVAEQLGGMLGRRSETGSSGLDCLSETEGKGNVFRKNAGSAGSCLIRGKKSAWKRGKRRAVEEGSPTPDIPPDPLAVICAASWRQTPALSFCSQPGAELQD